MNLQKKEVRLMIKPVSWVTCSTFITKWRFASAHLYTAAKCARKRLPIARPS